MTDFFGYDVTLCMNITDIDDKIITRANEVGALHIVLIVFLSCIFSWMFWGRAVTTGYIVVAKSSCKKINNRHNRHGNKSVKNMSNIQQVATSTNTVVRVRT